MKRILEMDNSNLEDFIISEKMTSFNQKPKDLQVVVVVPSVEKQNTFVLAGAGYRNAFIAEIYYHLFKSFSKKPLVLVLNPLDSLGENLV